MIFILIWFFNSINSIKMKTFFDLQLQAKHCVLIKYDKSATGLQICKQIL